MNLVLFIQQHSAAERQFAQTSQLAKPCRCYRPESLMDLPTTASVQYQNILLIRARGSLTLKCVCTCFAVSTLLSETERAFMSASGDTVGKTSCNRATSGDS